MVVRRTPALTTMLGLTAGVLTTSCWAPQLFRSYRTRSTGDISWAYIAALGSGIVLWLAYGTIERRPGLDRRERRNRSRRCRSGVAQATLRPPGSASPAPADRGCSPGHGRHAGRLACGGRARLAAVGSGVRRRPQRGSSRSCTGAPRRRPSGLWLPAWARTRRARQRSVSSSCSTTTSRTSCSLRAHATCCTGSPRRGLPWAVVTSADARLARARLDAAGVHPPVLVTVDEVSAGKPDPEGFVLAARRLGIPIERCLVVEDSVPGAEAGRRAGALVAGLRGLPADVPVEDLSEVASLLRLAA